MASNQARQNGEAGVGLGIELWAVLKFMGRLFIYPRGKGGKGVLFFLLHFRDRALFECAAIDEISILLPILGTTMV